MDKGTPGHSTSPCHIISVPTRYHSVVTCADREQKYRSIVLVAFKNIINGKQHGLGQVAWIGVGNGPCWIKGTGGLASPFFHLLSLPPYKTIVISDR